ncbi:ABC transporter permease [Taklimakanibacter deserti]|uniref:ABC transporter permease n=1 Tax=Taklimakanibacter deserti TaxID=2267839 RepID=UPI0034D7A474
MSGPQRELPRWVDIGLIPLINLLAALIITGLVFLAIGESPLESLGIMLNGAFGYGSGLGYTLFYTTNFIFTGLAFAVALHAGLFNIGAEGQAYLGGLGVALVCLGLGALPMVIIIPLAIAGAALFGAGWAFIPAYLQAKRGSHVVITTIMFNFIASALMIYLLVNVLSPPGSMNPETRTFDPNAHLPLIHDVLAGLGITVARSPLNLAFLWALICAVAVWLLMWHTTLGYQLRVLGANPAAAAYAGMKPQRLIIIAMLISGALSGFLALNEIMGAQNRLLLEFTSGYGFVGIAVALMGRSHPFGIVLAAILFGALYQGGADLSFEKPTITRDMIVVIQGLVILFAGALEHMFRPHIARFFQGSRLKAKEA